MIGTAYVLYRFSRYHIAPAYQDVEETPKEFSTVLGPVVYSGYRRTAANSQIGIVHLAASGLATGVHMLLIIGHVALGMELGARSEISRLKTAPVLAELARVGLGFIMWAMYLLTLPHNPVVPLQTNDFVVWMYNFGWKVQYLLTLWGTLTVAALLDLAVSASLASRVVVGSSATGLDCAALLFRPILNLILVATTTLWLLTYAHRYRVPLISKGVGMVWLCLPLLVRNRLTSWCGVQWLTTDLLPLSLDDPLRPIPGGLTWRPSAWYHEVAKEVRRTEYFKGVSLAALESRSRWAREDDVAAEQAARSTGIFRQRYLIYQRLFNMFYRNRGVALAMLVSTGVTIVEDWAKSYLNYLQRSFSLRYGESIPTAGEVFFFLWCIRQISTYVVPFVIRWLQFRIDAKGSIQFKTELHARILHWNSHTREGRCFTYRDLATMYNTVSNFQRELQDLVSETISLAMNVYLAVTLLGGYRVLPIMAALTVIKLLLQYHLSAVVNLPKDLNEHSSNHQLGFHNVVTQRIRHIRTFRFLHSSGFERDRVHQSANDLRELQSDREVHWDWLWDQLLIELPYYLWAWLCLHRLQTGQLTRSECLVVMAEFTQLRHSLYRLLGNVMGGDERRRFRETGQWLDLIAGKPELCDPDQPLDIDWAVAKSDGVAIELDGVSFGYKNGPLVLRDVSVRIPAHQVTAIVGRSGCGKTTLFHLLTRGADVTEGRILFNGNDIRQLRLRDLRRHVARVDQRPQKFQESVYYNVAYGRTGEGHLASAEEVVAALKAVDLYDRVSSQFLGIHGWDGKFSGGELQKLAMAQCLIKDAPVLLLDECTAALDPLSEVAIMDRIIGRGGDYRRRTVVMIAHRLSTVVDADQIIVMDAGRIVEVGSHPELLAKEGLYCRMWTMYTSPERSQLNIDGLIDQLQGES
ncbi:mitochondrial ABC iron transporter Atm1 [Tieghemiomyces parasiticus]|uniref:Mitochondrial ABC iron transporter Atm1 n=1 Tax=Tieghemiomyces parasiticus TaxID=78921 RepID=A0A9W7ZRK7_9FUNG|nr:mitochondrial ABC iron transporter Atm1 [Tieghemiomyces parasiticus]